jgi:transposase
MARRDRAWWTDVVVEWRKSGLTATEFAGRIGVSAGSLYSWSARLRSERRESPSMVPVRVIASTAPEARRGDGGVEVMLPEGLRVRFEGAQADAITSALLERLRRC